MDRTRSRTAIALGTALLAVASVSASGFPTGVEAKPLYSADSLPFAYPVWLGPFPAVPGAMMVGEAGGGLKVLEPAGDGYRKWVFGTVPAAFFAGNDGLLGVAFHPDYARNGRYFVCYNPERGRVVLEERRASPDRRSDAGPVRTLLSLQLGGVVHQGGDLHFGPDGFLYLAFGDGGNPNVYNARSRDPALLLGKMLRLDIDHADPGLGYAIPADNPYAAAGTEGGRPEIWASGLRQPWRFSFDADGKLVVGDVGDWVQEEVDIIRKGGDYGWSRMEGTTCFDKDDETAPLAACDTAGLIPPVAVLPHVPATTAPTACIIGGYVFRGDAASPFYGAYVFGDFVTRKLYALRLGAAAAPQEIGRAPDGMSTFGMDRQGNLYVAGYTNGIVYRLTHPDLMGKGVATLARKRAAPPRIRGMLSAAEFPGAEAVSLASPEGRVLRRYPAARLAGGVAPDLPRGIYLAIPEGPGAGPASALLIP